MNLHTHFPYSTSNIDETEALFRYRILELIPVNTFHVAISEVAHLGGYPTSKDLSQNSCCALLFMNPI